MATRPEKIAIKNTIERSQWVISPQKPNGVKCLSTFKLIAQALLFSLLAIGIIVKIA